MCIRDSGNTDFYLTGKDEEINLIIKTTDGKLKQYYADYKDYYYLPEEDTVIPKSLGSGIDRKHRKAATRNTCYTWFTCSDAFLSSPVPVSYTHLDVYKRQAPHHSRQEAA